MPESVGYARHYKLLKKIKFNIPTLDQQKIIVSKLDIIMNEIDTAIAIEEKKKILANEFIKTLYNKYFNPKIRPQQRI